MDLFRRIAEAEIQRGIEEGAFEEVAGRGEPLDLDRMRRIPAEERAACTVLKNAGMVPEEVRTRQELTRIEAALARGVEDPAELEVLRRRRLALELKQNLAADRRLGRL